MNNCAKCGATELESKTVDAPVAVHGQAGAGPAQAVVCTVCNETYVADADVDRAESAVGDGKNATP